MAQSNEAPLFSHHIFLFPFKWLSNKVTEPFEVQTSLSQIDSLFEKSNWEEELYQIDRPINYNEYVYFYDYVREILFDTISSDGQTSPLHSKTGGTEKMLRHYKYKLKTNGEKASYTIVPNTPEINDKTYKLEIDSILLQFYCTGVGILSFHLNNRKENQSSRDDILMINQFGRRIFPPFFKIPKEKVGSASLDHYTSFEGNLPIGNELAHHIYLDFSGKKEGGQNLTKNWEAYNDYENFKASPFLLPSFISDLFPKNFLDEQAFSIVPVLDDRMFVVSWYGNQQLSNSMYRSPKPKRPLKGRFTEAPPLESFLTNDWWYKYVHVDTKGLGCANEIMQKALTSEATNARWAKYGTLYGVTNYSFVMLTDELGNLGNMAVLVTHLQTIYYKLVELVLLQRATVQRFSDEITHISNIEKSKNTDDGIADKVSSLYMQYIRFVNKIYFREVTAQTQGIELYQLLQAQCNIEKQVKDLDNELNELHNYVLQITERALVQQEEKRNNRLEQLTILGAIFLPPSLILALYGVSILGELPKPCLSWTLPILSISLIILGLLSWKAFRSSSSDDKNKNIWLGAFVIFFFTCLLSPSAVIQFQSCTKATPASEVQMPLIKNTLEDINQKLEQFTTPTPVTIDTINTKKNVK